MGSVRSLDLSTFDCLPLRNRHLSQVIAASPETVYEFASNPENLREWAAGLAQSDVTREGDVLRVDSPMGRVTVKFVSHNDYGVIDHDVILPSGTTVTNPVRVLAHAEGSEVVFTVRQIELTDEEFERDCRMVDEDLQSLQQLLQDGNN